MDTIRVAILGRAKALFTDFTLGYVPSVSRGKLPKFSTLTEGVIMSRNWTKFFFRHFFPFILGGVPFSFVFSVFFSGREVAAHFFLAEKGGEDG